MAIGAAGMSAYLAIYSLGSMQAFTMLEISMIVVTFHAQHQYDSPKFLRLPRELMTSSWVILVGLTSRGPVEAMGMSIVISMIPFVLAFCDFHGLVLLCLLATMQMPSQFVWLRDLGIPVVSWAFGLFYVQKPSLSKALLALVCIADFLMTVLTGPWCASGKARCGIPILASVFVPLAAFACQWHFGHTRPGRLGQFVISGAASFGLAQLHVGSGDRQALFMLSALMLCQLHFACRVDFRSDIDFVDTELEEHSIIAPYSYRRHSCDRGHNEHLDVEASFILAHSSYVEYPYI